MNSYGNEFGYHTPELTREIFNVLKESGHEVDDLSWHNDEGDSIKLDNKATVWMPNGRTFTHFGYVPYLTTFTDDDGNVYVEEYDWDNEKLFQSKESLLEFLKQ